MTLRAQARATHSTYQARQWNSLCRVANRLLAGVPRANHYHALVNADFGPSTPRLALLKRKLQEWGWWEFFAARSHNYDRGLRSTIFEPFNPHVILPY